MVLLVLLTKETFVKPVHQHGCSSSEYSCSFRPEKEFICPKSHLFLPVMAVDPIKCLASPYKPCHVCNCKIHVITDVFAYLTSWIISTKQWKTQGLYKTFTNAPNAQFELRWLSAGLSCCKSRNLLENRKEKDRLLLCQKLEKNPIHLPCVRAAIQFTRSACECMANLWCYQEENLVSGECCCR